MVVIINNMKVKIQKVQSDGNCFFRSIALFFGNENIHSNIRSNVVKYLFNNKAEYSHLGITDEEIMSLREDGIWSSDAMDIIPKVCSSFYGIGICVCVMDNGKIAQHWFSSDKTAPTCFLLLERKHYSLLVPI
jgi:hypothetical protein